MSCEGSAFILESPLISKGHSLSWSIDHHYNHNHNHHDNHNHHPEKEVLDGWNAHVGVEEVETSMSGAAKPIYL